MSETRHESGKTILQFVEKRGWIIALVITAGGFFLRLPGIFEWWLNPDEGIYYSMVTWTNTALFWAEMSDNAHPPLFYLVIRGFSFFTTDFVVIRWLSLLFGSLAIYAAWLVGREIVSSENTGAITGLLSAVLLAVSPGAIAMSQVIRPYMMQVAFLLLALYHLLRFGNQGRTTQLAWYSGFLSAALLTHYSSVLAMGVFGVLIVSDAVAGRISRETTVAILAAHIAPFSICLGLFIFHLRPHLLNSALADEALNGWLAGFMIQSADDVWSHLVGFMGYLLGSKFAAPGALMLVASIAVAIKRKSRSLLTISLAAFAIAVATASLGLYPFGACRHCSWLIGFLAIPLAWGGTQVAMTSYRAKPIVIAAIVMSFIAGGRVGSVLGVVQAKTRFLDEQVMKRSDLEGFRPILESSSDNGIVLMSNQSYFFLLPFYLDEREAAEKSVDESFFVFRWGTRDVIVSQSWNFAAHHDDNGKPNHLYTFVQRVDRMMPRFRLGKQNEVLMLFGGWYSKAPKLLLAADQNLPPQARLISDKKEVPGLTAFKFDIARYQLLTKEALKQRSREPQPH